MAADYKLALQITAQDLASQVIGQFGSKLGDLGKIVAGVGAAGAVFKTLKDAAGAAAEEEQGVVRLGQAVKATGADWDAASEKIEAYIAKQTQRAALDDGEARDSLAQLTAMTGDYQQALELLPLTMDMARGAGMNMAQAGMIVGRVAAGNTSILTRYGLAVEEGATAQEALASLQARYAGQAEAYGNTMAGAQDRWRIAIGNLQETIGGGL